jgi:hypothetical protein
MAVKASRARNGSKAVRNPTKSILGAEASATLRDQLSSDYDAQSAVERELVLRLASLLWRLAALWKPACSKFKQTI